MTDKRGVVLHCPVEGTVMKTNWLDPQDLRNMLLFFDELVWPITAPLIAEGIGADYEFLVQAGVLRRVAVARGTTVDPTALLGGAVRTAFLALESAEPGSWAINDGENSVRGAADGVANSRGAIVRLMKAIPLPAGDVGLEDLLRFKEQRRPELVAMRVRLEELYQTIESAPDQPMAWKTQATKMASEINDCLAAARLSGLPWRWGNLEWSVSLSGPAAAALGAITTGQGWEVALNLASNAALPSLGISGSIGFARGAGIPRPWKYVASIHNDLMIGG